MYAHLRRSNIPALPWVVPINLSALPVGELQSNQLCEHRIYFTDLPEQSDADYVGFVTWRWFDKFSHLMPISEFDRLPLSENVIWVGEKAIGWYNNTTAYHWGIEKYMTELIDISGLHPKLFGFWSNQFICHKSVYLEWKEWFMEIFLYFHEKYGFNYDFYIKEADRNRHAGAFYERFSSLYFGNRSELEMKQIPRHITVSGENIPLGWCIGEKPNIAEMKISPSIWAAK